jgi:hypothetical protein
MKIDVGRTSRNLRELRSAGQYDIAGLPGRAATNDYQPVAGRLA